MSFSLVALQEWYWSGGPVRRLLVGVLISIVVYLVTLPFDPKLATRLLVVFFGLDVGAYTMDKAYIHRLSRGQG